MTSDFQRLQSVQHDAGTDAMLENLNALLRDRPHERFEAMKLQIRHRLGLPLLPTEESQSIGESEREALEKELLSACRTVGLDLLQQGKLREAWNYLRPLGKTEELRAAVAQLEPTATNMDGLIEILLYEGFDPARGFQLVLANYGTCNAITTLQSHARALNAEDRATTSDLLVDHLYRELSENVRDHIAREEGKPPESDRLIDWLDRPFLFTEHSYHVDTSHLSSAVQIGRQACSDQAWQQAWEMTEYGRRLDRNLQYPSDPPFEETFPTHGLYFQALLDRDRDEALDFFRTRAEKVDTYHETTAVIEIYIDLLARVGQVDRALQTHLTMIPHDTHTTGIAPSPLQLAQQLGDYDLVLDHYSKIDRILEYGLVLALANRSATGEVK